MGKYFFREPIQEIFECAALLRQAADAHVSGDRPLAARLIQSSNRPILRDWLNSVWGKASPYVKVKYIDLSHPNLAKAERVENRMPDFHLKRQLHARDGFTCRFCSIPVVRKEVREFLHKLYPMDLPWGRTNPSQHAAFQVLWAQYDHIVPHARGGTNELTNMVIACAACNFGRMNYLLDEVGINDPREKPVLRSSWSGMEDLLPASQRIEFS